MGNLLGEPFKDYVDAQINIRQDVHGKENRSLQELQYLNSKNAWIKLASGTSFDETRLELLRKNGNPLVPETLPPGMDLARENVLFNGLSKNQVKMPGGSNYQHRSGITGVDRAYGVGGTEQGYSPMPGIIDADIKDLNRGSIKKASINLKAHNRNQFEVIDALYLRLGYTVMLEWGVDKYLSDSGLQNMGTTLIDRKFWREFQNSTYNEILPEIESLRKKYQGNYDGMFGVISNFSWTFEADGSYAIKLELISQGDVVESLKANLPKTTKDNNLNAYTKLALERVEDREAQSKSEFFDIYPSLKEIIKDWYEGARKGQGEFDYALNLTYAAQFDPSPTLAANFPSLDLASYSVDSGTNPIKNEFNIEQAKELDAYFVEILNDAIGYKNQVVMADGKKQFTSTDYLGNPEDLKVLQETIPTISNDKNWNNGFYKSWSITKGFQNKGVFFTYLYYSLLASFFKNETSSSPKTKTQVVRRFLVYNLELDEILDSVFFKYKQLNYAGGPKDKQFLFTEPETPEEEQQQEQAEEEEEIVNELLSKRNKNRVFSYLYDVRNCWTEGEAGKPWVPFDGKFSKPIQLLGQNMGNIRNPTGPSETQGTKDWNDKVGFPIYPRTTTTPKEIDDTIKFNIDLKSLKFNLTKTKIVDFGDIDSSQPNAADFIELDITPINKRHFIRLGVFLQFLEQKVIPKIKTGSKKGQPMLLIDYHPENNICYTVDNVISLNPNKIVVENANFHLGGDKYEKVFPQIKRFVYPLYQKRDNGVWGNIMNIYINFARIEEIFEDVDDKNQVSIFSILKNISTDINESLGNINNIEPIIDKETNTIKFIDQTSIPKIDQIATALGIPNFQSKSKTKLQIFGINPTNNTSNFVRSAGITTEISKNYATMITIGATANGSIPGAEATAFSKWNEGISDRFKEEIIDADVEGEIEEQNENIKQRYANAVVRDFEIFGISKIAVDKYLIDDDLISVNKDVVSDFYIFAQAQTTKEDEGNESSIGFLPFNLKLSMDGLSGIKIYNKVNVDTSFLPSNYGETLSFIITGVNHKLSSNEWVTNLDTIATSKNKQTK